MATTDHGDIQPPPHPVPSLTDSELRDYRGKLERALNDRTVGAAPIASALRKKLDEVTEEQDTRQQARAIPHRAPPRD